MFGKLKDLPRISSLSGPYKEVTEFELEKSVVGVIKSDDAVVFVGRFCDQVVMCVGRVLEYEGKTPSFTRVPARLKICGSYVSFSSVEVCKG